MDLHQLRTFVAVAHEGSITRASERLHLSQPAVSAHIKAIEDAFDLELFARTARGMTLTAEGERLLAKAELALGAHRALMDEAMRIKGHLEGRLRLGAASNSGNEAIGRLLTTFSERCPDVEVTLEHGRSSDVLTGIRNGTFDAGFYNEGGEPDPVLQTIEVSRFKTFVVAAPSLGLATEPLDWRRLADLPWIYPTTSACCGRTAEELFAQHHIRPKRIVSVDRESVTRSLIAGGLGIGLLHADTAEEARARGEVEVVAEAATLVRVLYAFLASRAGDPILAAAAAIVRGGASAATSLTTSPRRTGRRARAR